MNLQKKFYLYDATVQLIGVLLLFTYTFLNKHPVFWDESYYLSNLRFIDQYGVGKNFLLNMWGPAGPLFTVIHYLLRPITEIGVPGVRLVFQYKEV